MKGQNSIARILPVALAAVMFIAIFSFADIYKCVSDDGVVTFSDQPCSQKAEVLYDEEELVLDEIVDSGAPFSKLAMDASTVNEELLAHAKKMGKCLLPDEPYNTYSMDNREYRRNRYPEWNIELNYGPPEKAAKWRIRLEYRIRHVDGIPRIWFTKILMRRWNYYEDPPVMQESQRLEKIRAGQYRLVGWITG